MIAIKCELCGSNDMEMIGEFFVCRYCGMKYSKAQAQRIIVQGKVEVTGNVRIDNSELLEKHLQNARRALSMGDWDNSKKFFSLAEELAPNNIEALFYRLYSDCRQHLTLLDFAQLAAALRLFEKALPAIFSSLREMGFEKNYKLINQLIGDVRQLPKSYHESIYSSGAARRSASLFQVDAFNMIWSVLRTFVFLLGEAALNQQFQFETYRVSLCNVAADFARYLFNAGKAAPHVRKLSEMIRACDQIVHQYNEKKKSST
ncbi:MAG: hypothetical protein IJP03_04035 [Christensenellaceae bacterium]|nr:hypothetical protein [Christensenellaceae bacterium]